jgi:hypothetical protein
MNSPIHSNSENALRGSAEPPPPSRTLRFDRRCVRRAADRTYLYFSPVLCFDAFYYAVVKVPPSVGCVKYKAQHIVLPMQILQLRAGYKRAPPEMAGKSCGILREAAIDAGSTPLYGRDLHIVFGRSRPACPCLHHRLSLCLTPAPHKAHQQCNPCGTPRKSG